MSNQVILWATLIVPWASLFFMKKEDIKRFFPAGLLAGFMSIVVSEIGVTNGWWYFHETTYPFSFMATYTYGLFPILPMWILKYTYGNFKLYIAVELVLNAIFSLFLLPWFSIRDITQFAAGLIAFILSTTIAVVVYRFQIWQEELFVTSDKNDLSVSAQPVAKPLSKAQDENTDNK
ncbi:MAG: hypothetical protein H6Q13_3525 [Bacteroidetes bacterium]|nr:hypothetical protein [Bacteroidota bacterium]